MKICKILNCNKEIAHSWTGKYKDTLYCKEHSITSGEDR